MSLLANINRGKRGRRTKPADFNPFTKADAKPIPIDDMRMLKPAFEAMKSKREKRKPK